MSIENAAKQIQTKVEGRNLYMERVFDAPRELVFKVYSEAEHLEKWWGPKGWGTTVPRMDFKVGGEWLYGMKCNDPDQGEFFGMESWGLATYQLIDPPERIVYTDAFVDQDGNKMEEMPEMIVDMRFVEIDGKTKIITRSEFATEEALNQVKDMGVVEGVSSQYERLDEYLASLQ